MVDFLLKFAAVYDAYFQQIILPYMNAQPKSKLLQQVSNKIRFKHYSIRTGKSYFSWIKYSEDII